mmetsp:Transcript_53476/g.127213  ORF Transcript_53476/g.127213 Transcript_53476/m.127213 type:complete len:211 (-) Transcript_53476:186-818(-)
MRGNHFGPQPVCGIHCKRAKEPRGVDQPNVLVGLLAEEDGVHEHEARRRNDEDQDQRDLHAHLERCEFGKLGADNVVAPRLHEPSNVSARVVIGRDRGDIIPELLVINLLRNIHHPFILQDCRLEAQGFGGLDVIQDRVCEVRVREDHRGRERELVHEPLVLRLGGLNRLLVLVDGRDHVVDHCRRGPPVRSRTRLLLFDHQIEELLHER